MHRCAQSAMPVGGLERGRARERRAAARGADRAMRTEAARYVESEAVEARSVALAYKLCVQVTQSPCRSGVSRDRDLTIATHASFAVAAHAAPTVAFGCILVSEFMDGRCDFHARKQKDPRAVETCSIAQAHKLRVQVTQSPCRSGASRDHDLAATTHVGFAVAACDRRKFSRMPLLQSLSAASRCLNSWMVDAISTCANKKPPTARDLLDRAGPQAPRAGHAIHL